MSIECAFFGALGRDAEVKTSKGGKQYLRLNVRVDDGEAAQWLRVMAFDPDANAAAAKMVKGARVYIEGRLSVDEWTGQNGAKRHGLSVMSRHCRLTAIARNRPRKQKQGFPRDMHAPFAGRASGFDDDVPFAAEAR
jgi:single-stranded DNA-binding protein